MHHAPRRIDTFDGCHTIQTHYLEQGQGTPVVLLHGGLESGAAWDDLAQALASSSRGVLRPDRRGHGRTPDVDADYNYAAMARETMSFLEKAVGEPADLVGYSDGGICALLTALERPQLVRSMVLIGTNFHHSGILAPMVERFRHPDPQNPRLAPMRQVYGALSPDGQTHWDEVYRKVCAMALSGPDLRTDDLRRILTPALLVVGDDDVIDHRHTIDLYEALPDARLAVLPSCSHLLPLEAPDQLRQLVQRFLDGQEPQRIMAMRKRPAV